MRARSCGFRKPPRCFAAAVCGSPSRATTCASSKQSFARARQQETEMLPPRSSASRRRSRAQGTLANERVVQSTHANVVDAEREKLARYRRELDALRV